MKTYDVIVIGFGKAGKTLAAKLANQGKKVALIEENKEMYGGTCINIGCIPTKTLIHAAEKGLSFEEAMLEKDAVVSRLNAKNFDMVDAVVDIYTAHATFLDDKVIELSGGLDKEKLTSETIIINTGAVSNVLPIEGLTTTKNVYDSTGIQKLSKLPKRLGIIGGGNIGLEFASLYAKLGSQVSILEAGDKILPREENTVSQLAKKYMEEQGIVFELGVKINHLSNNQEDVIVNVSQKDIDNKDSDDSQQASSRDLVYDAVLYATGRKANIQNLGLENTSIQLTERGAIQVDEFCQTTVPNVFAVGDVNGGLQFTYVSLDDFRVVWNYLNGNKDYSLKNRKNVPTTIFINPPLSRVGLTEEQVKELNLPYVTKELPVANMPRGHVNSDLRGVFKAIVNPETKEILGATLFGAQSSELINLITMAMDNHIPYTYLAKQLFTHPTMAENLNDLFSI
ncbi:MULTISPECIES: FAD-containing oxidoreductase [unclassified Gemella]|uniref:FAD-containing oxidoreductase n=1 Tax=unclassified Gemella TaxID=2624949 RepID=UPI00107478B3|nr:MULTISPECIES: FAD-containing oxidoreductase [unclassified Gemella]MBF0710828.1 FAD-containing oxidoreductase [Gemella sp. GL1.1]MBF0746078.1 FAD-containing oxidoreductase [Gemella sp. 19428wG2_WT2a]NYS28172.1 FAD-containing oxidoreductase [Gemella sp. GL1]TFU60369.1 FAD-containing oxidoreductase [Gemella sp. WT2a]